MKSVCLRPRFIIFHILITYLLIADSNEALTCQVSVPIGVVVDTNSALGSMLLPCMQMALLDYYDGHPNSTTILHLHTRNAQTVVQSYFAVVDLMEREQVECIIGPQGSTQDLFTSELGQTSQVPIISVTARSTSLSTKENNFFIRTTVDDLVQARSLAAICERFQWPKAVLLYEDTEYGHQFQSHLTTAFRGVGIGLVNLTDIPLSADNGYISELLALLNQQETKVFLVHMSPSLGFRLFNVAKNMRMMREGSAWLITDSLSNFLSSADSATRDSMEGVVGVRPYVPSSKDLRSFQERWVRNNSRESMDLNVYGLWAYDAIHALAIAAEKIASITPNSCNNDIAKSDTTSRISAYGSRLVKELSNTRFRGLSGNFEVVDGGLKASDFEIVNLIGTGEKRVGFWNSERGITREASSNHRTSNNELKTVVWPGDSTIKPKGWAIPNLRVGVPWKHGFNEFVSVEVDSETKETRASGFAIDIFLNALVQMKDFPLNYTFYCYNESTNTNWSYDSMLHEIPEKYDMVVADVTIWAPRASYVDFSLPYSESGVVFVVNNHKPRDLWTFVKPMSWDLWLAILVASLFMGFFIWRLEQPTPAPANISQDHNGSKIAILVPITALAFPERTLVKKKTSVFVLACWLLTTFVLMQSYTANLSAMLTLDRLKFSFSEDNNIGYQKLSFTKDLLMNKLHFNYTRLKPYLTIEEYHDAMSKGSKRGGIDAIFDELPYMKLFLNKYGSRYKMIGPTYRTDGFGFAFTIGSRLVAPFSRAILNVTQGSNMTALEQTNFGPGYSSQDPLPNMVSQGASSLAFYDFAGLFIVLGTLTTLAFGSAQFGIFKENGDDVGAGDVPPAAAAAIGEGRPEKIEVIGDASGEGGEGRNNDENGDEGANEEIEVVEREERNDV